MLTVETTFEGTAHEKKVATAVLEAMQGHGRFMAVAVPIKVSLDDLATFLTAQGIATDADALKQVVAKNRRAFLLEEVDGRTLVVTTRIGQRPIDAFVDSAHTFAERFMTPLPKPEKPTAPPRERLRVAPSWSDIDELIVQFDLPDVVEFGGQEAEIQAAEAIDPAIVAVPIDESLLIEDSVLDEVPVPSEPVPSRVLRVPAVAPVQYTDVDDVALADAIGERLRQDTRIANFGDQWMLEERVPRFSRGDLRRLKDYIQEQEQPLTDELLVQDVLGGRPGTPDFDLLRFAVNFRLSREHREFDFVGTTNQRFWSTSNLPQIGTTRKKPNEIGADYRYLLDESPGASAYRSIGAVDHVLTFYEYHLGLIPYDADVQALLPAPLQPNQRSAVLTFECPQSYTTYLVELRYPTPNRGGFILGLDDFYNENLVPGAYITIERTDNDGHYLVRYTQEAPQNARLLELEERRQRYVFRPTTYACGVLDEFLLTEERFPNFGSEKPLEEKTRRRPESVVAASFERLGHKSDGPGYVAAFDDLMAAVNIERPYSERFLRSILETDETGAFAPDPDGNDAYTYVPGTTS